MSRGALANCVSSCWLVMLSPLRKSMILPVVSISFSADGREGSVNVGWLHALSANVANIIKDLRLNFVLIVLPNAASHHRYS